MSPRRPPRNDKYPWEIWADGQEHVITYGQDFKVEPQSMIVQILNYGNRHDTYPVTRREGSSVRFKFHDTDQAARDYAQGTKQHVQRPEAPQIPPDMITRCLVCDAPLSPHEYNRSITECTGTTNGKELTTQREKLGETPKLHTPTDR